MRKKRAIKRFFLTLMWLGVAIGMGTVITAAMRAQEAGVCNGYSIQIEGFKEGMLFTSKEQIAELLKAATKGDIKGQPKSEFNLPVIEDLLEQSAWVYNADLYFDNNNVLHANVTERKPLARVFTNLGTSFYIDEAAKQIPLSDKVSLDLPVFTGYPSKKIMNGADSALVQNVIATASFINEDPFWSAQVAQIDINNCGADCWTMSMIPVVGNHKVDLGDGTDIASKFHRLYLFYDQVLKRTGFDKYQKIDVQYNGQVIGVKGHYSKIDSMQLRKNIESLLQQSRESNEMLEVAPSLNAALPPLDSSQAMEVYNVNDETEDSLLYLDNDKPEILKKEAPVVVAAPKKAETKTEVKKDVKPFVKAAAKPAVSKPVATKTTDKKIEPKKIIKKAEVKKPETKTTSAKKVETKKPAGTKAAAGTAKKTEVKKTTVTKKPEAKKEEVKRNLLAKPEPEKKTQTKSSDKKR
ncbi:hypothetical protein ACLOAU_11665 [Niabella sp. CJ426]|uniref:hypothetical protein n=1 Tax=Niabella sp. CJ426 TaxID=3393740 RepID=UPI003CFDFC6A